MTTFDALLLRLAPSIRAGGPVDISDLLDFTHGAPDDYARKRRNRLWDLQRSSIRITAAIFEPEPPAYSDEVLIGALRAMCPDFPADCI